MHSSFVFHCNTKEVTSKQNRRPRKTSKDGGFACPEGQQDRCNYTSCLREYYEDVQKFQYPEGQQDRCNNGVSAKEKLVAFVFQCPEGQQDRCNLKFFENIAVAATVSMPRRATGQMQHRRTVERLLSGRVSMPRRATGQMQLDLGLEDYWQFLNSFNAPKGNRTDATLYVEREKALGMEFQCPEGQQDRCNSVLGNPRHSWAQNGVWYNLGCFPGNLGSRS